MFFTMMAGMTMRMATGMKIALAPKPIAKPRSGKIKMQMSAKKQ